VAGILRVLFATAISGAIHYYVWWRLAKRSALPPRLRRGLAIATIALWASIPITTTSRLWWPDFASRAAWVAMPWMAFVGLCAVALGTIDLVHVIARLGARAAKRPAPPPEHAVSRRRFLARVTGGAAATAASTSVAAGILSARGDHEVSEVEIHLAKLPRALDGFTIVQLSDLHTGLTIDRAFVDRVVDRANALSPDLIALTGDLVDGPVPELEDDIAPLARLRARHGVFAVTGNHEYYAGADPWIEHITSLGARYLRNQLVTIGDGDATFDLAGVDDHSADRWNGHGEDLDAATRNHDPARALVLLAHQPRQVRRAAEHGVDLQLSGHTHGGQIWPWHYIVSIQQGGLLAGRYEHARTQLYVSRGCGYWGPPVRLLAPLEITRVILRTG
jgi:predicted MPP superfamily phosphohydrolase